MKYIYWQDDNMWLGSWTQEETEEKLRENLLDNDLTSKLYKHEVT